MLAKFFYSISLMCICLWLVGVSLHSDTTDPTRFFQALTASSEQETVKSMTTISSISTQQKEKTKRLMNHVRAKQRDLRDKQRDNAWKQDLAEDRQKAQQREIRNKIKEQEIRIKDRTREQRLKIRDNKEKEERYQDLLISKKIQN